MSDVVLTSKCPMSAQVEVENLEGDGLLLSPLTKAFLVQNYADGGFYVAVMPFGNEVAWCQNFEEHHGENYRIIEELSFVGDHFLNTHSLWGD